MKKLYLLTLVILFSFSGFSQSYPYLNASMGNENEFPVDKDTNIYLFHGNRLVKMDKNFNTVWANTYSGINFSNVLLSKTGSIYFAASSGCFGKINSNGSLSWVKSSAINATASLTTSVNYSVVLKGLLLDRNNNLVLSGYQGSMTNATGFILKTDTNGNGLAFKVFGQSLPTYFYNFSVMSDSAGIYKLLGYGMPIIGSAVNTALFNYNDNLGIMLAPKSVFNTAVYSGFGHRYLKSKFSNNYYIHVSSQTSTTSYNMAGIAKVNMNGQLLWNKEFSKLDGSLYAFSLHIEEDAKGKLLYSADNITGPASYTSGLVYLDSNGTVLGTPVKMINGAKFLTTQIASRARVICPNKYYFDVIGSYFPSSPLTIQKFDSTLLMPCSPVTSFSTSVPPNGFFSISSVLTAPITSFTLSSVSSSVAATTFTTSSNLCIVLGTGNTEVLGNDNFIYPNPASDKIFFENEIMAAQVFDVNGKNLRNEEKTSYLYISDLPAGIYFIRIKTDKGEFNKKFIKE